MVYFKCDNMFVSIPCTIVILVVVGIVVVVVIVVVVAVPVHFVPWPT